MKIVYYCTNCYENNLILYSVPGPITPYLETDINMYVRLMKICVIYEYQNELRIVR